MERVPVRPRQSTADRCFACRNLTVPIVIGVLGALAAACVGFLDLFAIPTGTPASRTGVVHMGLNLAVTAAYAAGFLWRRSDGYAGGQGVGDGQLTLSAVALATLGVSGYLGGKLAYRYGDRMRRVVGQGVDAGRALPRPARQGLRPGTDARAGPAAVVLAAGRRPLLRLR